MTGPASDDIRQKVHELLQSGQDEVALIVVRQAMQEQTGQAVHHILLATIYQYQGRMNQAIHARQKACALEPENTVYLYDLANLLLSADKLPSARNSLQNLTGLDSSDGAAWLNLGIVERKLGNPAAALACYEQAISLLPDDWRPLYSKGNCLQEMGDPAASETWYRKALALAPAEQQFSIRYNLSSALSEQVKVREALALLSGPDQSDDTDWQINRALLLLQNGQLLEGLDLYQRRFDLPGRQAIHQDIPSLANAPDNLTDKTVLLWGEQGFGDSLQFIRFASRIRQRGATVLFDCRPPLVSLLAQQKHLIDGIWQSNMQADYQYPVMSLPILCCADDTDLSPRGAYITPTTSQPDKVIEPPRVAISWAGFAGHHNDKNRSMPDHILMRLLHTMKDNGYAMVSLQMNAEDKHRKLKHQGLLSDSPGDHVTSFQETAAILQSCKALISVDTAAIHLAGALALPSILLLPFNPDWRWGLEDGTSHWYDHVYCLRQNRPADWNSVIDRLTPAMNRLMA